MTFAHAPPSSDTTSPHWSTLTTTSMGDTGHGGASLGGGVAVRSPVEHALTAVAVANRTAAAAPRRETKAMPITITVSNNDLESGRSAAPSAAHSPSSTGRPGSAHHCDQDPGNSATGTPIAADAATTTAAVTPDPQ